GLILTGVLERHPTLRVAFLESGSAWLPYWLDRMDGHLETWGKLLPAVRMKPSEYFRRQCVISTDPEDGAVEAVVRLVGDDCLVWASDYPHPDALFPGAVRWPFQAASAPGLSVYGDGRGCNTLTGRFLVLEGTYGADGGVQSFAADFEQHCEDGVPALFGSIRYRAGDPACAGQPDGTACDDQDACTQSDACQAGQCTGTPTGGCRRAGAVPHAQHL